MRCATPDKSRLALTLVINPEKLRDLRRVVGAQATDAADGDYADPGGVRVAGRWVLVGFGLVVIVERLKRVALGRVFGEVRDDWASYDTHDREDENGTRLTLIHEHAFYHHARRRHFLILTQNYCGVRPVDARLNS